MFRLNIAIVIYKFIEKFINNRLKTSVVLPKLYSINMKDLCLLLIFYIFLYHVGEGLKHGLSLTKRVQQLSEMSNKNAILQFNTKQFQDYVTSTRSYSVIIMFTAMAPHWKCTACRDASDEFTLVAHTFRQSQEYSNNLFFAVVDYDEAPVVFEMLGIDTAPKFIHFPPKGMPEKADILNKFSAKAIAEWITARTDIEIRISHSAISAGTFGRILQLAFAAWLLYLQYRYFGFLYFQKTCQIAAIFFCLTMMSGQMWNHIMKPRFVGKDEKGQNQYFDKSIWSQFELESYIVLVFYAGTVLGIILLLEAALKVDSKKKRTLAIVGLVLVAVFFSLLLLGFKIKIRRYPYSFSF